MNFSDNNLLLLLFGIIIIYMIIKYKKTKEKYAHCTEAHRKANREKCGKDKCVEGFYGGCGSSVPHTHSKKKCKDGENCVERFYGGHKNPHHTHHPHHNIIFDPLNILNKNM